MNIFFNTTTLVLSGTQVLLGFVTVAGVLSIGILLFKKHLMQQAQQIKGQHNTDKNSPIIRKYEEVDFHRYNSNIKMVGTVSALMVVVIAFAWTQFTQQTIFGEPLAMAAEVEMEVPITTSPPKSAPALPPPPMENPTQVEISPDPIEPTPEPEPTPDPVVNPTPSTYTGPTDPNSTMQPPVIKSIPPPPPTPKVEEGYISIAEKMPLFPGCEQMSDDDYKAKKTCADKSLMSFVNANISYPEQAREMEIEGTAVVSFIVDKDGTVRDYKILRDPGGGLGREALRVVKLMNKMNKKWTAGKQRGRKVNVKMNMPVKFQLNP